MRGALLVAAGALGALALACFAAGEDPRGHAREDARRVYRDAIESPRDATKRAALDERLPYVAVLDAYVVEGDRLLKAAALQRYLDERHDEWKRLAEAKARRAGAPSDGREVVPLLSPELKVNWVLGRPDIWRAELRDSLSYAVDRASFGADADQYDTVVTNLRRAAEGWNGRDGWEQLCPACRIDFRHIEDVDLAPSFERVLFIVKRIDTNGEFVAAAPFPSTPVDQRYLYVDPTYFETDYDPVGVFRHELGHVLGYRHEQLEQLSGCYQVENDEWDSLSDYDPRSVMHYFCNTKGTLALEFTSTDRESHARAYAP